ncbi:MAG: phosphoribosylanthranilate isomerase [Crenarchaeota archaeon]|nr:phosphoribosylanthranilate isomerase [Thermoproteota archaeon]
MVRVKICGVKRVEDALMLDGYVDYIGLIVDPEVSSPRKVDKETARAIVERLIKSTPVAVVVSEGGLKIASELGFSVAQFHSDSIDVEKLVSICSDLGLRLAPVVIYRGDVRECLRKFKEIIKLGFEFPYVLVDADKKLKVTYERGLKLPIEVIKEVTAIYDRAGIAGNLNPNNVELVLKYRPYLVDVASGVEIEPGVKSAELVRRFLEKVRRSEEATH